MSGVISTCAELGLKSPVTYRAATDDNTGDVRDIRTRKEPEKAV